MTKFRTTLTRLSLMMFGALTQTVLAADITGTWSSDTIQTKAGKIQNEYIFNADGTFVSKSDDRGLCEKQAKCEHFWMISEGTYTLDGDTLKLNIQKERGALKSSDNPKVAELPKAVKPYTLIYTVSRKGGAVKLVDAASQDSLPLHAAGGSGAGKAADSSPRKASHKKQVNHQTRSLPSGDMRHCLDLKTNEEIIACSEKRAK